VKIRKGETDNLGLPTKWPLKQFVYQSINLIFLKWPEQQMKHHSGEPQLKGKIGVGATE